MQRISRWLRFTQPDLTNRSGLIQLSNIVRRRQSVSASVVSDDSKVTNVRKRVPKDERRAMVESYAIEYKEMNGGKFPTASETTKQVGGSYYIIRNILQEIKYRSKSLPSDPKHQEREDIAGVNKASVNVTLDSTNKLSDEVVNSKSTLDGENVDLVFFNLKSVGSEQELNVTLDSTNTLSDKAVNSKTTLDGENVDLVSSNLKSVDSEQELNVTLDSTNTLSNKAVNVKTTLDGEDVDLVSSNLKSVGSEQELSTSTLSTKPLTEHVTKPKSTDSSSSDIGTTESKVEKEEMVQHAEKTEYDVRERSPSEFDKLAGGNSDGKNDNEELSNQTSLWGNLKSIAHGIFKIWRAS